MIEMRWLTWEEEENIVPPVHQIQFGKPFDKHMVVKRKLQYRQMIDTLFVLAVLALGTMQALLELLTCNGQNGETFLKLLKGICHVRKISS